MKKKDGPQDCGQLQGEEVGPWCDGETLQSVVWITRAAQLFVRLLHSHDSTSSKHPLSTIATRPVSKWITFLSTSNYKIKISFYFIFLCWDSN